MRKFLHRVLSGPVIKLANKYSSRPDQRRVHAALTSLYEKILENPGNRGLVINFDRSSKMIVFSDQHKGSRDFRDDFLLAEKNYLAALQYYNQNEFLYCNLGDSEELWENTVEGMIKGRPLSIFLTHGHQGDLQSDGNWFSKWFVSTIWGPLQSFLRINPNTPAYDNKLKSEHNQIMYDWTAMQRDLVLITGHTHQPVFNSLTHLERMYIRLKEARKKGDTKEVKEIEAKFSAGKISGDASPRLDYSKNTYFNTGCGCFDDGDITGIELENGMIRLVEWKRVEGEIIRVILEESTLEALLDATEVTKITSR